MTEAMLRTHEQDIRVMGEAELEEMRRRISMARMPEEQRRRLYRACDTREQELLRRRDALVEHSDIEAE